MLSPLASGQKKAPKCVTSGGNIGSCFKIQNQRRRRRHRRRSRARAELWTPEPTRRRRRRRPIRRQLVGIILLLNEINVHPPPLPLALARLAVCSSSGSSPQLDEASNCGVAYPVALSSHVATVSAKMARPTARQTYTHAHTHTGPKRMWTLVRTTLICKHRESASESPNRAPLLPPLSRQTRRCSPN